MYTFFKVFEKLFYYSHASRALNGVFSFGSFLILIIFEDLKRKKYVLECSGI